MALYYYYAMLIVSLVILVVYVFIFHKHFDASITIMAVLIPIVNFSNVIIAGSQNIEEAKTNDDIATKTALIQGLIFTRQILNTKNIAVKVTKQPPM